MTAVPVYRIEWFIRSTVLILGGISVSSASEVNPPAVSINQPGAADEVGSIRDAWARRFTRFGSFRYENHATLLHIKGQTLTDDDPSLSNEVRVRVQSTSGFPAEDMPRDNPFTWIVDRVAGRFRKEATTDVLDVGTLTFETVFQVNAFDGNCIWTEDPNADYPDARRHVSLRESRSRTQWLMTPVDYPIMFAHGIFPSLNGEVDWADLDRTAAARLKLEMVGHSSVDGIRCAVVMRSYNDNLMRDVFYVDNARDAAIMRWERQAKDSIVTRVEVKELQEENGTYLPVAWRADHYRSSPPVLTEQVDSTVTKRELDPTLDLDTFSVPDEPGTLVLDYRSDRLSAVAADGRTLLPASSIALNGPNETGTRSGFVLALIIINSLVLGTAIILWRRKRSGSPTSVQE